MSTADMLLLDGEVEPVTVKEFGLYRVAQRDLDALASDTRRGRLIVSSPQIRNGGLELRRTPRGTMLIQVRKALP